MSRKLGQGHGSVEVFVVEARLNYVQPETYRGMILDKEWRRIQVPRGPIGVPNDLAVFHPDAASQGFLSYDTALAIAHWFMVPETLIGGLCVETRLVKILYKYEYSTEEKGVSPAMSMVELRRATAFADREATPAWIPETPGHGND